MELKFGHQKLLYYTINFKEVDSFRNGGHFMACDKFPQLLLPDVPIMNDWLLCY